MLEPMPSKSVDEIAALAATLSKPESHIVYYSVSLPSKGRLGYPDVVEYRDIMVKDEKLLAASTATNYISNLHKILKGLLKDQSFFNQLSVADRDYLLLWIWANNYSPEKDVEIECPSCEHTVTKKINLTKLAVKDIDADLQFPFVLEASTGVKLNVRPFTVGMQEAATTYIKDHADCSFDTAAVALSFSVEGRLQGSPVSHIKWVEDNIRGKDFALVRAFHEHYAFGVADKMEHTCPACGEVNQVPTSFRLQWLLPSSTDDFEKMLPSHQEPAHQSD